VEGVACGASERREDPRRWETSVYSDLMKLGGMLE